MDFKGLAIKGTADGMSLLLERNDFFAGEWEEDCGRERVSDDKIRNKGILTFGKVLRAMAARHLIARAMSSKYLTFKQCS